MTRGPTKHRNVTWGENRTIKPTAFRNALRVALSEILEGSAAGDELREERGWKLFFLLPRMLLSRPP